MAVCDEGTEPPVCMESDTDRRKSKDALSTHHTRVMGG
jgi:hypothetical protein